MKKLALTLAVSLGGMLPAKADMPLEKMQMAIGLAKIIHNADKCGYEVNQAALSDYYARQKLDDPEALAFVSSAISMEELDEDGPSKSDCTMAITTAKSAGLISG